MPVSPVDLNPGRFGYGDVFRISSGRCPHLVWHKSVCEDTFNVPYSWDAAKCVHDPFQLLFVPDVNGDIHNGALIRACVIAARLERTYIARFVAENGRELVQNSGPIVGVDHDLDW